MAPNPPPAPDWILGDDGHWKPPPFTTGRAPTAPPPGTPPTGPQSAWAGYPPPPPSSGASGGRTVAVVLGVLGVAGVAIVGLLVGAVTFLGTSSEAETPRSGLAPATSDAGGTAEDETASTTEAASTTVAEAVTPSVMTADAVAADLTSGGEWVVTGVDELHPQAEVADGCTPDGWLTGATDRFRTFYGRVATQSPEALTVSLTTYADPAAAQADLERARSQSYRDCEVQERLEETTGTSSGATVTALPDDPLTPGVTYQIDLQPGDPLTEYEFTVIVGQQRAHLDFCGCADLGLDGQHAIAQAVARDLAAAQGLPNPG